MTSPGIRPPSTLTDPDQIARWYAEQLWADECVSGEHASDEGYDPATCDEIHGLLLGALEARVIGYHVPVDGGRRTETLSSLFAPYRRQPGGEAEKTDDWLEGLRVMPRRRRSLDRRWIP